MTLLTPTTDHISFIVIKVVAYLHRYKGNQSFYMRIQEDNFTCFFGVKFGIFSIGIRIQIFFFEMLDPGPHIVDSHPHPKCSVPYQIGRRINSLCLNIVIHALRYYCECYMSQFTCTIRTVLPSLCYVIQYS